MRTSTAAVAAASRETVRTHVQSASPSEQSFVLADVARLLWPKNTAAHVASIVGCSVRAAEMYLAGDREWSGDALAALIAEILKRHGMRNVRVKAR